MGEEATQPSRKWDGVLRRSLSFSARAIDEKTRSVQVIASTDSIDAHGDILEQDWNLDRYRKNPVVLWAHNQFDSSPYSFGGAARPEDFLPIGRAEDVKVSEVGLEATLVFASAELNPLADRIFRMMQEKMLNAVSVGFRPGKVTQELQPNGRTVYRLGNNELREISVVPLPSNPDAVAKSIAWEREHLGRMAAGQPAENAEETTTMAMTPEEKAAHEKALYDAKSSSERASALEAELKAEKAASKRFEDSAKSALERAAKAEASNIEAEIDKLIGKKLVPAQRDEYLALAKEIGIDRVKKICATHLDVKLTETVRVAGEEVRSAEQNAAEPVEGGGNASSDIADIASKAASAA